jgi:hypothetical protein
LLERALAPFELVQRLRWRTPADAWAAMLVNPPAQPAVITALVENAKLLLDGPLHVVALSNARPETIAPQLRQFAGGLILTGTESWDESHWRAFDLNRSALEGLGPVILVLSAQAAGMMADYAPNVAHFIGGSEFTANDDIPEMTSEQRERRLRELREMSGWQDADLIRKREAGELRLDEHLSEWLALLDRQDLL